jgi:hypothetical protein
MTTLESDPRHALLENSYLVPVQFWLTQPACLRLVKVFKDQGNHRLLKLELARAAALDPSIWKKEVDFHNNLPEFPFISTCMLLGTSVDVDTGYSNGAMLMPWNLEVDGGDNNDGVTILDITDPTRVCYCFVTGSGTYQSFLRWEVGNMLSGSNDVADNETRRTRERRELYR